MGRGHAFLACMAAALFGLASGAAAQSGAGLPLPPGQIVVGPVARGQSFTSVGQQGTTVPSIANGVDANNFLGLLITPTTLSFVNSAASPAVAVLTTAPTQYVRFYLPGSSGQAGSFTTRAICSTTATGARSTTRCSSLPARSMPARNR